MTGFDIIDFHVSGTLFFMSLFPALPYLQINQATHDQALVLQSALQNIPNPASECMLRNVAIRLAQQISDEVTENVRNRFFSGGYNSGILGINVFVKVKLYMFKL